MSLMQTLETRFEGLQPRERTLASVTAGVVLVLLLYVLWIEPASKAAASQAEQIATLEPQVASTRESLAIVQRELAKDPEAARRVLLEQLKGESGELDARLRADEATVIPPSRMPAVLRDLMGRDPRLAAVGVEALAPEALRWRPPAAPDEAEGSEAATVPPPAVEGVPVLYRHRVVLRFEGDFAATLDYLRAVESLPMRIRLSALEVDAEAWPRLGIVLEVETLGLEAGWIGA